MFADDTVIGLSFPAFWIGSKDKDSERSMIMGYTSFRQAYRTPELVVCMMLTGIYYFNEFDLLSISGQRFAFNRLSPRFLAQFGVRDTGYIPDFLMHNGKLVDCYLSNLSRADFERYVTLTMLECVKGEK
jgi:hypothetical protein